MQHQWKPYFGSLLRSLGFRKQCVLCGVVSTSDEYPDPPEASVNCPFADLEPEIELLRAEIRTGRTYPIKQWEEDRKRLEEG